MDGLSAIYGADVKAQISNLSSAMMKCFSLVMDRFEQQEQTLNYIVNFITRGAIEPAVTEDVESYVAVKIEPTFSMAADYLVATLSPVAGKPRADLDQALSVALAPVSDAASVTDYDVQESANWHHEDSHATEDLPAPAASFAALTPLSRSKQMSHSCPVRAPSVSTQYSSTNKHRSLDPVVLCSFCKVPSYRSNLRRHVRAHHEKSGNPIACPICGALCAMGWVTLREHFVHTHPEESVDTYHRKSAIAGNHSNQTLMRARK